MRTGHQQLVQVVEREQIGRRCTRTPGNRRGLRHVEPHRGDARGFQLADEVAVQHLQLLPQEGRALLQPQGACALVGGEAFHGLAQRGYGHVGPQGVVIGFDRREPLHTAEQGRQLGERITRCALHGALQPGHLHGGLDLGVVHQLQLVEADVGQRAAHRGPLAAAVQGIGDGPGPVGGPLGFKAVFVLGQQFDGVAQAGPLARVGRPGLLLLQQV